MRDGAAARLQQRAGPREADLDFDEIILTFKNLGFTEYETKVYVALLAHHPATAYSLSRASGVPHSRIYDIARRLIKKGLAIRVDTQPERFSPLSPQELVDKLRRESGRHIDALENRLGKLRFQSDFDPVWNVTDREEALQVVRQLIGEAHSRLYLGAWDPEIPEVLGPLETAEAAKVEIYLLVYGNAEPGFGNVYHHSTGSLDTRFGRTIDFAADSDACLSGYLGGEQSCQVVWTRNPGLVQSIEEYIIHDLYLAEIQKALGPEIRERFGRNLSDLRRKFGRSM